MRRRTFLRAGTGVLAASSLGRAGLADARPNSSIGRAQSAYAPHGSVDIEGAREAAVGQRGDVVYVAANDGFASVDVSDPGDPTVLAERRGGDIDTGGRPLRSIWDAWPSGDRLVVAGPAHRDSDSSNGFALFDVSDPADPRQVAFHATDFYIHNTYFTDDVVYLTGSGLSEQPLVMIDVTGGDPEEAGRWSLLDHDEGWEDVSPSLRALHDVYVQDGIAYLPCWDAGTWLVDVSDPANPKTLSSVGAHTLAELRDPGGRESTVPPGNDHYCQVDEDGSLLAVGRESWAVETGGTDSDTRDTAGGASGVTLYDVSDPTEPEELATIDPPESFDQTIGGWFTTAHNFDIVDDRLYTSWYFGGVKLHDVSDPTEPEELAWWRDPDETSFWTAQVADGSFVASSVDGSAVGGNEDRQRTREALFTFPDRPGRQENPPDLTVPPGEDGAVTPTRSPTEDGTSAGATRDGSSGDTGNGGGSDGGKSDDGRSDDGEEDRDGDGGSATPAADRLDVIPSSEFLNLGIAAVLAGLGFGVWRYFGRGAREEEGDR